MYFHGNGEQLADAGRRGGGASGHGSKLVPVSPYTSMAKVAAKAFPFLPVRLLVLDRFDTEALAPHIELPVLIVHGTQDELVPFAMGEQLSRLFPHATLYAVPGGTHNTTLERDRTGTMGVIIRFVKA